MDKKQLTLIIIKFGGEQGLTPLKLQKGLFLISKKFGNLIDSDFYDFKPYNYGPFAKEIYQDTNELERENLVKVSRENKWDEFSITQKGSIEADKIMAKKLDSQTRENLGKYINWINSLTFNQLTSYIYDNYKEYKVNSIIV